MRFCLITGSTIPEYTPLFMQEAQRCFDVAIHADLKDIIVACEDGKVRVLAGGTDLATFDIVYVRAMGEDFLFAEIVLDILENAGVEMPNTLEGYQITNHKFSSVQRAATIGVPVPDTVLAVTPEAAQAASKEIGLPIIVKLLRGSKGKGVLLVRTEGDLKPILDTLEVFDEFLLAQRYVPNPGEDIRALVIGDDVIGIRRHGAAGEFRANVSQGGRAEFFDLDKSTIEMARHISELLCLDICAVDFVSSDGTPYLIEVNFCPGVMSAHFGDDLAKKMIRQIQKKYGGG